MDKILGYYFVSNYDQVHWHNDPILKVDDKKAKKNPKYNVQRYIGILFWIFRYLNISIIKIKKNHLHLFGNFL